MTYTVKYKLPSQLFFRTIKGVKGDLVANDIPGHPRVLVLEDETRIELPSGCIIKFCPRRFMAIKQKMDEEAGHCIQLRK